MNLDIFFEKDQVITLKSTEKQLVVKELIGKLADLSLIENQDRYYAQIIHRESLENTGIGNGFAIPHARTDSVDKFISIIGYSEEGIEYQSIDGKPVHFILLSIFPSNMSTKYLYLIGMMARIFSNQEKMEALIEARTPGKIYTTLKKESTSYFKTISDKETSEPDLSENLSGVPSSDLDLLIRLDQLYRLSDEDEKKEQPRKKIESLKKLIDNKSLTYYERMKSKKNSPFAIVEKNSCMGCHMEIPPVNLRQIRDRKGVPVCTHCGRFLILV